MIKDLAHALAPDLPTHVIGIRPGEKIHEVMISEDDARHTLELPDRYVIEPEFAFWSNEHFRSAQALPLPEDFSYSSNTNAEWLDVDGLHSLLNPASS